MLYTRLESYIPRESPLLLSVVVLVLVNISSVWGIWFLGWTANDIAWVYIFETVIIGLLNVPRILLALKESAFQMAKNLFFTGFFFVHYNAFLLAQIFCALPLFVENRSLDSTTPMMPWLLGDWLAGLMPLLISNSTVLWFIVAIFGSHLFSFLYHYLFRGEFRKADPARVMIAPYRRIMMQQLLIFLGAAIFVGLDIPNLFLPLLIVLKILIDIAGHLREHREAQNPIPSPQNN